MQWHSSENTEQLAHTLAETVTGDLRAAIEARGQATLALSGGNTPKPFMEQLARCDLAWSKVIVTLVDERWVPADHPRSNAGLVRSHLLKGAAAQATFIPLYAHAPTPESGLPRVASRLDALPLPLDVAVLGMGEDGHTASFFPEGDHLREALDPNGSARVLPMRAPGAEEPRITLSLSLLIKARALYLHIEGDTKRRVLDDASQGADLPIGAVLNAAPNLQTYWCP
ncbi:6-phosphogluconolactonase [Oleiagrimonas soli]|uniref:6-phosphogluconolactonase n=1 Tax=Oleiagrimonas soli TaxID=1543381 RepID=A0A099CVE5_9GAMM|nr:6-phosphogluconolactonase [Oleiagrimonas soli]KGI77567.1 6-phosphogluconolactonase [Oleiagrimonas soli]MBB6182951.1 6-phosphogluconolactonase [Oleiagrimonas soli]